MIDLEGSLYKVQTDSCETPYRDIDDFILCQFTGLQDKNNKDVYEGDICNAKFRTKTEVLSIQGKIIMDEYMWCIECNEEIYSINRIHDIQVISNIYEN
jgi:uncharacterized phage protein (TIGR01671 family)